MPTDRVAYWRAEFERLEAMPQTTMEVVLLKLTAAYMLGWSIAAQNGNWPAEEPQGECV